MMHPDIEKAIELIENKISELQRAKQTLLEAFGEKSINSKTQPLLFQTQKTVNRKFGSTRRDAVLQLLKEQGPLPRFEIIRKIGIPRGTLATILNDKNVFTSKNHKWNVLEPKEKGLTDSQ
ncbi:MAG TPA: hypothetical protein VEK32_11905 [Thermodesulfobacteriota bacterium]|nr:hypothetical protein [Thermodesulfobacteriota bacterium]